MSVQCEECGEMAKDEKSIIHSVSCKEGQAQLIKALESKGVGGIGFQRGLELLGKLGVYANRLESAEDDLREIGGVVGIPPLAEGEPVPSVLNRVRRVHTELMGQADRARRNENVHKALSKRAITVIRAIQSALEHRTSALCESRECGGCDEDDIPCEDWGREIGEKARDELQAEYEVEQLKEKYERLKRIAIEAGIDLPGDA